MTRTIPETRADARAVVDRVAGRARETLGAAKSAVEDSIGTVSDRTRLARDWASERIDLAREMPSKVVNRGADYLRARPFATLAVALAIGYVVGRLMGDDIRGAYRDRGELDRY